MDRQTMIAEALDFVRSERFEQSPPRSADEVNELLPGCVESLRPLAEDFAERYALDEERAWSAALHFAYLYILNRLPRYAKLDALLRKAGS